MKQGDIFEKVQSEVNGILYNATFNHVSLANYINTLKGIRNILVVDEQIEAIDALIDQLNQATKK